MSDANNSSNTENSDAESMEKKFNAKVARRPSLAQPWTIHRVPHGIRAVDEDAYEPKMLSIGPYHRSNTNLQAMEDYKWHYVQAIVRRNQNRELSNYLEEMKRLEVEVRRFYSENIEMESKEFVEMMLLDGCFIVELFLNVKDRNATAETDDPIYSTKWILPIIRLDMLLLENQLPFLVVKQIFQLVNGTNPSSSIEELALRFFGHLMPMKKELPSSANSIPHSMNSIHHLLHLFHQHLLPTPAQSDTTDKGSDTSLAMNPDDRPVPPSRSMLSASNIRFLLDLGKKKNASSIVEVEVKDGRLKIPTLCINHSTNAVFRNLIAWEHCHTKCGTQFTTYAFFMNCLIDSPKAVEILKDLNIIEHWLGNNEEVALLFNQMCIGITYDWEDNFLSDLFEQVARMKRRTWSMWRYNLLHDFFPISFIGAMTLYLSFVQVMLAIFPPGKKNS